MNKLAAAVILCLFSAGAMAQALPPGMKMHQTQAGKPDASGWLTATSTEGGYSVRLPCAYNDFTMNGYNPAEPVEKGYTVGCMQANQKKFSATRLRYRNGAKDAQAFFDKAGQMGQTPGAKVSKGSFKKMPLLDVRSADETRCGFLRFVQLGADNLVMVVEAPAAACAGLDAQAATFFKSLTLKK